MEFVGGTTLGMLRYDNDILNFTGDWLCSISQDCAPVLLDHPWASPRELGRKNPDKVEDE